MHVTIDRRDAAGKAGGLDFKAAILFEVRADRGHRLTQTNARMATLPHEFAVVRHVQRSQRQISLIKSAVRFIFRSQFRIELFERLQSGDSDFLWMLPA